MEELRSRLRAFLKSRPFEIFITSVIALNAVTLGAETSPTIMGFMGEFLTVFDNLVLIIFIIELLAKFFAFGRRFFLDGWNWFDTAIVGIALMPATGAFSVMRALRILRVLRLISVVPALRRVVGALITALPGMASIIVLMTLVFYVFAVMSTKLFGVQFPQWFGSLGASAYSLFQIMTLESWSMGIVRPVMDEFPWAWAFFVPFILSTSFVVLNLFIGIIVSAMQAEHEAEADEGRAALRDQNSVILEEVMALREEIRALKQDTQLRKKT